MGTTHSVLLATAAFVFCLSTQAQPASPLAGRWRSTETSKGGIGAMYEFGAKGDFRFSPGAIVTMPYRLEGPRLIFPPATTTGAEQVSTLQWESEDVFRMDSSDPGNSVWRRQGTALDKTHPLVGEWLGTRNIGGQNLEARIIFDPAGSCLLLIRFLTQTGSYTASPGRLHATLQRATAIDGTFTLTQDLLTIRRDNGKVMTLRRY